MPLLPRLLLPFSALAIGAVTGLIQPVGIVIACLFMALVLAPVRLPSWPWYGLVTLTSLLLAAHLLPGFEPWFFGTATRISEDAPLYLLRLSWDKMLVGCTLLAWWLGQPPRQTGRPMVAVAVCVLTIVAVPSLALAIGVVDWQPKWPEMLWPWLIINLSVAVLAEELLFRGVLQPRLTEWLGTGPGITCGALLFGAAHIPFSPMFAVVATAAGFGYGLAFHCSGRLSVAIALHGAVNLLHFTLLSYPLRVG